MNATNIFRIIIYKKYWCTISSKNTNSDITFICKNTIEEKIIALHQKKKDLSDNLLTGTNKGGSLSEKELLNLIQSDKNI